MRPDQRDLDAEIRGHLALSIKERIDRGEHPAAGRPGRRSVPPGNML